MAACNRVRINGRVRKSQRFLSKKKKWNSSQVSKTNWMKAKVKSKNVNHTQGVTSCPISLFDAMPSCRVVIWIISLNGTLFISLYRPPRWFARLRFTLMLVWEIWPREISVKFQLNAENCSVLSDLSWDLFPHRVRHKNKNLQGEYLDTLEIWTLSPSSLQK